MNAPLVVEIAGKLPGKIVTVMAGVHGNEKAGVIAVKKLMKTLKIVRGKVFLIIANPEALAANTRFLKKNLNRSFYRGNRGRAEEDRIARRIMAILDQSDAMLDLHAYGDPGGTPFVICSKNDAPLAEIFGTRIISYGWEKLERGASDGYMFLQGKPGVCLECGDIGQYKKYSAYAEKSIKQFLKYFSLLKGQLVKSSRQRVIIKPKHVIVSDGREYAFTKPLKGFDALPAGEVFLKQGNKAYRAKAGEVIIFPRLGKKKGEEICLIAEVVK